MNITDHSKVNIAQNRAYLIYAVSGFLFMAVSLLFLNNDLATGTFNVAALFLFLCAERSADTRPRYICTFVLIWLGYSIRFSGMFGTEFPQMLAIPLLVLLLLLIFGVFAIPERFFYKKKIYLPYVLMFPFAYSLLNNALIALNIGNQANVLTYVMCAPWFRQDLRWLGEFGMTFVLALFLSLMSEAVLSRNVKGRKISAVCGLVILAGLAVPGAILESRKTSPDYTLQVAVAVREEMGYMDEHSPYSEEQRFALFRDSVKTASENNADLLVLCEEFCDVPYERRDEVFASYAEVIREYQMPTLLGANVYHEKSNVSDSSTDNTLTVVATADYTSTDAAADADASADVTATDNTLTLTDAATADDSKTDAPSAADASTEDPSASVLGINEILFFDSEGNILCTTLKNNLVPFVETGDFVDGPEEPGVLTYTFGEHEVNIACVLCYDINDYFYIRKIPENTELLLTPSWDWDTCNIEQKRMQIRSVERNTTLLHHCYDGFTYTSGPYGLYGDYMDFRDVYETVRMIEVPVWKKN